MHHTTPNCLGAPVWTAQMTCSIRSEYAYALRRPNLIVVGSSKWALFCVCTVWTAFLPFLFWLEFFTPIFWTRIFSPTTPIFSTQISTKVFHANFPIYIFFTYFHFFHLIFQLQFLERFPDLVPFFNYKVFQQFSDLKYLTPVLRPKIFSSTSTFFHQFSNLEFDRRQFKCFLSIFLLEFFTPVFQPRIFLQSTSICSIYFQTGNFHNNSPTRVAKW